MCPREVHKEWVLLIGRILFAAVFIGSGLAGHFGQTKATAQYGEMRGLPNARMLVLASGAWITTGGISVAFGVWTDVGALMLAIYALVAAFWVHHFWTDSDMMQQIEMTNFMKNISLAGGAVALFAIYSTIGDALGTQIVGPLFNLDL
jgi:uncharacterized membrane protein YphA (DoxX/SURF4 family)